MDIEELQRKARIEHVSLEDWDFETYPIYWTKPMENMYIMEIENKIIRLRQEHPEMFM